MRRTEVIARLHASGWTPVQIAEVCGVPIRSALRELRIRPAPADLSASEAKIWRAQELADYRRWAVRRAR